MKYIPIAALALIAASCGEQQPKQKNVHADTVAATTQHDIVHATVSSDSSTLDMTFNNTNGTAVFVINGDTIDMKQDTMASGVKYSNATYQYTEWHGNIRLTKDGKVIFEKKG